MAQLPQGTTSNVTSEEITSTNLFAAYPAARFESKTQFTHESVVSRFSCIDQLSAEYLKS